MRSRARAAATAPEQGDGKPGAHHEGAKWRRRRDHGSTLALFRCAFDEKDPELPPQGGAPWSGRPGSNRRPQPWQGCALPTEPRPRAKLRDYASPHMRIGIFGGEPASINAAVATARAAAEQGFSGYWVSQIFGFDALSVLAIVGREVPGHRGRHRGGPHLSRATPMMLAQQALTVNAAAGGGLVLGIGLSHQVVIEHVLGLSFEKPVRHMREYLSILVPLIQDRLGELSRARRSAPTPRLTVPEASPLPVLVAALGPNMLELAGTLADGTMTWMTGPETLGSLTVPTITRAAEASGRPAPRIGAGMPVCVTDDEAGARARAAQIFQIYGVLPSYRAMLDREGACRPRGPRHRRHRSRGADPDGPARRRRCHGLRRGRVRPRRVETARAPGSCSAPCCDHRRAALAARAARGAGHGGGGDRSRPPPPRDLHDAGTAHAPVARRSRGRARRDHGRGRDGRSARSRRGSLPRPRRTARGRGRHRDDPGRLPQAERPRPLRPRRRRGRGPRDPYRRELASSPSATRSAVPSRCSSASCSASTAPAWSRSRPSRLAARTAPRSATTPLLLLHGDRDEILPPDTSAVVQALVGHGELVILAGAGHLLTEAHDELRERLWSWIPARLADEPHTI